MYVNIIVMGIVPQYPPLDLTPQLTASYVYKMLMVGREDDIVQLMSAVKYNELFHISNYL